MVYVFYDALATIYLTKVNLPNQYLTQEAALGYGCDERVMHDIDPIHPLQPQHKVSVFFTSNPSLLTHIYRIQAFFQRGTTPKCANESENNLRMIGNQIIQFWQYNLNDPRL
jgi:hypothetical protein